MKIIMTAGLILVLAVSAMAQEFNITEIRDSNLKVALRSKGNINFTQSTNLVLNSHRISDITALQSLIKLTSLELYNNQITDISALGFLINLSTLNLGKNQIRDISSLSNLQNLRKLSLHQNPIRDLSPLAALPNLQEIDIRGIPADVENMKFWAFTDSLQITDKNGKWTEIKADEKARWGLREGVVVRAWLK